MNADTKNQPSHDKKRCKNNRTRCAFKAVLVLSVFFVTGGILFAIIAYVHDYCYLESLRYTNEEIYELSIESEKIVKSPGWEERVKEMEAMASEPDPDEGGFHSFITSFCPEPGNERKPDWVSDEFYEGIKKTP